MRARCTDHRSHEGTATRRAFLLCALVMTLAACATQPAPPAGQLQVVTLAQGKPLSGAECVVSNLSGSWQVTTPGMVMLGEPNGDLRVVCNHPGYRSSEVIYRLPVGALSNSGTRVSVGVGGGSFGTSSGVGVSMGLGFPLGSSKQRYPAQLTVDLTPAGDAR